MCYLSVNDTDCPIKTSTLFSGKQVPYNLCGPTLRFEIALMISSANVIRIYGSFPCGFWTAIKFFKKKLVFILLNSEKVVAGSGYEHEKCFTPDDVSKVQQTFLVLYVRNMKRAMNV